MISATNTCINPFILTKHFSIKHMRRSPLPTGAGAIELAPLQPCVGSVEIKLEPSLLRAVDLCLLDPGQRVKTFTVGHALAVHETIRTVINELELGAEAVGTTANYRIITSNTTTQ